MTNRPLRFLGTALCLSLLSACGSGNGGSSSLPPGSSGGGTLWLVTGSIPILEGLDTSNGQVGLHLQIGDGSTDVWTDSLVAADGLVWVGRTDGVVVAVDTTGATAKTINVDATGGTIEMMVAGGGAAYALSGSADGLPQIAAIDAQSLAVKIGGPVISEIAWFAAVAYEPGTLWVLGGNEFVLSQVDAASLSVKSRVPLGQDPDQPLGARGEYYGDGFMAVTSSKIWIIDDTTRQLLSVDKASLKASYVSDLSDLLDAGGPYAFESNGDSAFLSLPDQGKVIRFDGATGARAQTYALGVGVASDLAVARNKLYVTDNHIARDVFEIDVQSGVMTNTYKEVRPSVLAVQ